MSVPPPPPPPFYIQKERAKDIIPNFKIKISDYSEELNHLVELEKSKLNFTRELFKTFQPVNSILQDGPTCGMTALAMGLKNHHTNFDELKLKELAIKNSWSFKGEMYSCNWMQQLAHLAGAQTRLISNGIHNHLECISFCLQRGEYLLVPYDKDKDHSPGHFQGVNAHWAIVIGLIVFETSSNSNSTFSLNPCQCMNIQKSRAINNYMIADCNSNVVMNIDNDVLTVSSVSSITPSSYAVPYVIALQGQSSHLKLWPFLKLASSNINLITEGDARKGLVNIPPEGVKAGLSGQAVLMLPN